MAAQRALPQSKEALLKSYTTRLKEDVKSMLENFEGTPPNLTFETTNYNRKSEKIVSQKKKTYVALSNTILYYRFC